MNKLIATLATLVVCVSISTSQNTRYCIRDEQDEAMKLQGIDFTDSITNFNAKFQSFKTSQTLSDQIVYIPVVFHVVYSLSNPAGNISAAQITDGLITLNNSFANQSNYVNGVNCKFQFCLAKVDYNNNVSSGITRHVSPKDVFYITEAIDESDLKSYGNWPGDKYLNIWIANIKGIDKSGAVPDTIKVKGYSSFPWELSSNFFNDGVVISPYRVGSTGLAAGQIDPSFGKTLPHEVAHWLGLHHTFHGGCLNANCSTQGDFVCDTDPVNGTAWDNLDDPGVTCSGRLACDGSVIPSDNYMDYNDEICQNLFTAGQKDRMRFMCSNYRNYFWINSINNPQVFPIECTSPGTYTTSGGANTSTLCTNSQLPSQLLYVNGDINTNMTLCNGTPVIINRVHGSNCTLIPKNYVSVPCNQDPYCGWLGQLIGLCDCAVQKVQFWLSIGYNCDGNFNCQNETGSWFTFTNFSDVPDQIDIASMLNFQFMPNNRYRVKLAGTYYNLATSTYIGWNEGQKFISFVPVDLYETGTTDPVLVSTNSITFENALIPNGYSDYNTTNLIKLLPNTTVSMGCNSRFYLSPHNCNSNVYRLNNPHNDTTIKDNNKDYIVTHYPQQTEEVLSNTFKSQSITLQKTSLSIIPNPSSNGMFLIKEKGVKKIDIYNNLQVLVGTYTNTNEIDLSNQATGIYYAQITTNDGTFYEKLIYAK